MTRAQRQAAQPKFTPRQWPSDPQSTYLLARAERIGEMMRRDGRWLTQSESERHGTRISARLGK
jgi:hypothetical protein